MPWNELLTALNYVLADLFPFQTDSARIVNEAGLPPAFISFSNKAIDNWYSILSEADKREQILDVIRAARRSYPENPILTQAEYAVTNKLSSLTNLLAPELDRELPWRSDLSADNLEKLMGKQSTLLPISFLEVGLQRARSVARVQLQNGGLGSGFLTAENIFVTNHHVLHSAEQAATATLQFNYQQTSVGLDLEPVTFGLKPSAGFATSKTDDWTMVRVDGNANSEFGAIDIDPIDVSRVQRVNIIQHPSGGPKQIALYHNVVAFADDKRVQYLTDTLPGSSGSPVFDDRWRLVALHHSGGWIVQPGAKQVFFRNEGININLVERALTSSGLLDAS
jgi:hypothetical protein